MLRSFKVLPILVLILPAWGGLWATPVRFHAEPAVPDPASGSAVLRLLPQAPAQESLTVSLSIPGDRVVDIPAGTVWQVLTDSPGFWSVPQWIAPTSDDVEHLVTLRLFPAATAAGRLQADPGQPLPAFLDLRLEASPGAGGPRPALTTSQCPIEAGRFRCKVPAGTLDLRLRPGSFLPSYLWDLVFRPGEEKDLGAFPLRPGTSVVGWVRNEEGKGLQGVRVQLAPQALGMPEDRARAGSLQAMTLETPTNTRGFFQFEAATPGTYFVTATGGGFASVTRPGIEVLPGLEAQIRDPLVPTRPLTFHVTLDPPRDPAGNPWRLILSPQPGVQLRAESYRGVVNPEGTWEQAGLPAGTYLLSVRDEQNGWLLEELELTPGRTAFHFSLSGVRIRGRVTLGAEPLAATVWFGGRSAPERARVQSDPEGRFEGLLPREGTWKVELFAEAEKLRLKLDPVEVRRLPGKDLAIVDLRVPDTRLCGQVVDERRQTVAGASVLLVSPGRAPSSAATDAEGSFEVRGLRPGRVIVHAVHQEGELESDWLAADLKEDGETPELRLVLRPRLVIHGRVFSARGPVAGAQILARSEVSESGAGSGDEATSGAAGEFTVKLPAGTRTISLSVIAAGHAIRMLSLPLGAEPVIEIPLEPVGGTLVFDLGERTLPEILQAGAGLLAHGGTFVSLQQAAYWARLLRVPQTDPHRLELPHMEPGEYQLCVGSAEQTVISRVPAPSVGLCSGGSLAPLQELVLTLPAPPKTAP